MLSNATCTPIAKIQAESIWQRTKRRAGQVFHEYTLVDSVFEHSLVNVSSANTSTFTEEAYEDRLAALW